MVIKKDEQQDKRITALDVAVKLIAEKLDHICEDIKEIKQKLDHQYISKIEYEGCKLDIERRMRSLETVRDRIGWFIVLAVLGAVISLVIINYK